MIYVRQIVLGQIAPLCFAELKAKTNWQDAYAISTGSLISSYILGIFNYPSALLLLIITVMLSKYVAARPTGDLLL